MIKDIILQGVNILKPLIYIINIYIVFVFCFCFVVVCVFCLFVVVF